MIPLLKHTSIPIKSIILLIPAIGFSNIPSGNKMPWIQEPNNAPTVKLVNLFEYRKLQWNSTVNYKISVNDKEDGNSEYNEITPTEVLLKIKYFSDSTLAKSYIKQEKNNNSEATGLTMIKSLTCFTCHQFKTKLIGPSFESIALKYIPSQKIFDSLSTKIIKGAHGVWGDQQMPPHPDVTKDQANQMLQWIFKNAVDPNLNYLTGLEGVIHTNAGRAKNSKKAIYVLTASYRDHGLQGQLNTNKRGQDMMILRNFETIK